MMWEVRTGFAAGLSFARQFQQLLQFSPWADFLITTEASQPCRIRAAISLIFRTVWSRPVNTKPGICIFEEQRYNSSRCFLTSSCYSCKNAEELLKQALKKGRLPVIIFRQPVSPKDQCPQVWDLPLPYVGYVTQLYFCLYSMHKQNWPYIPKIPHFKQVAIGSKTIGKSGIPASLWLFF